MGLSDCDKHRPYQPLFVCTLPPPPLLRIKGAVRAAGGRERARGGRGQAGAPSHHLTRQQMLWADKSCRPSHHPSSPPFLSFFNPPNPQTLCIYDYLATKEREIERVAERERGNQTLDDDLLQEGRNTSRSAYVCA